MENFTPFSEEGNEEMLCFDDDDHSANDEIEVRAMDSNDDFGTHGLLTQCMPSEYEFNSEDEQDDTSETSLIPSSGIDEIIGLTEDDAPIEFQGNLEANATDKIVGCTNTQDIPENEGEQRQNSAKSQGIDEIIGLSEEESPIELQGNLEYTTTNGIVDCLSVYSGKTSNLFKAIEGTCLSVYNGETQSLPSQFPLTITEYSKNKALMIEKLSGGISENKESTNYSNDSYFNAVTEPLLTGDNFINRHNQSPKMIIATKKVQRAFRHHREKFDKKAANVTLIQAVCRSWLNKRLVDRKGKQIILIQAVCRSFVTRKLLRQRSYYDGQSIIETNRGIIAIQSVCRSWLSKRLVGQEVKKIIMIQAVCRSFVTRKLLRQHHCDGQSIIKTNRGIVAIQSVCRSWLSKRLVGQEVKKIIMIQAVCRSFVTRKMLRQRSYYDGQSIVKTNRGIVAIQSVCRSWLSKRLVDQEVKKIIMIQAVCRSFVTRKMLRQRSNCDGQSIIETASIEEIQTVIYHSENTLVPCLGEIHDASILSYSPAANNDALSYPKDYLEGKCLPHGEHNEKMNQNFADTSTINNTPTPEADHGLREGEAKIVVPFSVTPISQNLLEPQIKLSSVYQKVVKVLSVQDEIIDSEGEHGIPAGTCDEKGIGLLTPTAKRKVPHDREENDHSSRGNWFKSKRLSRSKRQKIEKEGEDTILEEDLDEFSLQLRPPRQTNLGLTELGSDDIEEKKYDVAGKINEEVVKESVELNDTQPGDEFNLTQKATLSRLKRGLSVNREQETKEDLISTGIGNRSTPKNSELTDLTPNKKQGAFIQESSDEEKEFIDQDLDEENEFIDQDFDEPSQSTVKIRTKLRALAEINVSQLTTKLRQPLGDDNSAKMKLKIEELMKKNSFFQNENRQIKKENIKLLTSLGRANKKLQEKKLLCNEMQMHITRLEPVINAAVEMGNLPPPVSSGSVNNLKRIIESDTDDGADDEIPQEDTIYLTPKKDTVRNLPPISTSSRRPKPNRDATGKVTFAELWRFLQNRGWKFRTGPEPFGKVYVPPSGSVCKGSVLGTNFYAANDLWGIAAESGFVDCDDEDLAGVEEKSSTRKKWNKKKTVERGTDNATISVASPYHRLPSPPAIRKRKCLYTTENKSQRHSISTPDRQVVAGTIKKVYKKNITKTTHHMKKNTVESDHSYWDKYDNRVLCGTYNSLTERSMIKCAHFVSKFLSKGTNALLMRDLFAHLWKCIKVEQGNEVESLGWNYIKSRGAGNLGRSDWFAPPNSAGSGGLFGKDYFTTEEAVVAHVFRELKQLDHSITGFGNHEQCAFDAFEIKLSRAIEDHMSFDEASNTPPSNSSRRSRKRKADVSIPPLITRKTKNIKKTEYKSNCFEYSQNTMKGAEILLGMTKATPTPEPISYSKNGSRTFTATAHGIEALIQFRSDTIERQRKGAKSKVLSFEKTITEEVIIEKAAVAGKGPNLVPSKIMSECHLTQSPSIVRRGYKVASKVVAHDRERPLDGLHFFASGIIDDTSKVISRLGGKLLNNVKGTALKESSINRKLFFISDPKFRRTHKYTLACALGVPMLHFNWLFDLEKSWLDYKRCRIDGIENEEKRPGAFDARRYSSFRLPLGLSIETGIFVMQRARDAKKWSRPRSENSGLIFDGLTIAVALENSEVEKKWIDIISTAGAKIASLANLQKFDALKIDMVLVDSICLPPHVTAVPARPAKFLNCITRLNKERAATEDAIPIVDLSWVSQCIVRRTRVSIDSNGRYRPIVDSSTRSTVDNKIVLFSIKVKSPTGLVRYEVGDSINFGTNKAKSSTGRIMSIYHDARTKKNVIEVKVLELHNQFELMDGGKNVSLLKLDENELQGHIILLGGNDFMDVYDGWARDSSIVFMQKKV